MEGVATEAQQTIKHTVAPFCSILDLILYLSRNKMDHIHLLQVLYILRSSQIDCLA
jgi:hypothetical protein